MEFILICEHLSKKKKKFTLSDICFQMEKGYIYGIVGGNGSGKSTLLESLLKECETNSGKVIIDGLSGKDHYVKIMNMVGFISENRTFFPDLAIGKQARWMGAFYDNFDEMRFENLIKEFGLSLGQSYDCLSRGEKLKFQLALEIAHQTKLFLLDDVTAGMDPVFKKELFDFLRKQLVDEDVSVLMTSLQMDELKQNADYIAILQNGCLSAFEQNT